MRGEADDCVKVRLGARQNVMFRCVADGMAGPDSAIMENITPPMPAKRALERKAIATVLSVS
jgi:hypothetical protein